MNIFLKRIMSRVFPDKLPFMQSILNVLIWTGLTNGPLLWPSFGDWVIPRRHSVVQVLRALDNCKLGGRRPKGLTHVRTFLVKRWPLESLQLPGMPLFFFYPYWNLLHTPLNLGACSVSRSMNPADCILQMSLLAGSHFGSSNGKQQ